MTIILNGPDRNWIYITHRMWHVPTTYRNGKSRIIVAREGEVKQITMFTMRPLIYPVCACSCYSMVYVHVCSIKKHGACSINYLVTYDAYLLAFWRKHPAQLLRLE